MSRSQSLFTESSESYNAEVVDHMLTEVYTEDSLSNHRSSMDRSHVQKPLWYVQITEADLQKP